MIEQTLKKTLPNDFQSAETVLKNGFIDQIVGRNRQRHVLTQLLRIHQVSGGEA